MGADVLTLCHRQVDVDVHVPGGGVVNGEPRDTLQVGDGLYVHGRCPATTLLFTQTIAHHCDEYKY